MSALKPKSSSSSRTKIETAGGSHLRALELDQQGVVERAKRGVFVFHRTAARLRTTRLASKLTPIRALIGFYQIGSSLRKRNAR
jgi:hypothetical protein